MAFFRVDPLYSRVWNWVQKPKNIYTSWMIFWVWLTNVLSLQMSMVFQFLRNATNIYWYVIVCIMRKDQVRIDFIQIQSVYSFLYTDSHFVQFHEDELILVTISLLQICIGIPCNHILKITDKIEESMVEVKHWKIYPVHFGIPDFWRWVNYLCRLHQFR